MSLAALAFQYLGAFLVVSQVWPLPLATVKLVTGWVAVFVLAISMANQADIRRQRGTSATVPRSTSPLRLRQPGGRRWQPDLRTLTGRVFRLLTGFLVGLVVFSLGPFVAHLIPGITLEQVWGGFFLIGMGLLQLGFSVQPLRTILGLLTVLAGFELIYAVVESSTLVAGLLGVVNLGLAFTCAYLLIAPGMEETD